MTLLRVITVLSILLLLSGIATGQETWEGNAARIRRGEFAEEGMFAASNSFPQNTVIEVVNPRTGKTVEVTVMKRIESGPQLFLLLSDQAADAIGLSGGDVERVGVVIPRDFKTDIETAVEEPVFTSDEESFTIAPLQIEEPLALIDDEDTGTPTETTDDTASETAVADEEPEPSDVEVTAESDLNPALWEFASREPQKNLYALPRDPETFLAVTAVPSPIEETPPAVPDTPVATPSPPQPVASLPLTISPAEPIPPEQEDTDTPVTTAERPVPTDPEPLTIAAVQPVPPEEEQLERPIATSDRPLTSSEPIMAIDPAEPAFPLDSETAAETLSPGLEVAVFPDILPEPPSFEQSAAELEPTEVTQPDESDAAETVVPQEMTAAEPQAAAFDLPSLAEGTPSFYIQLGAYLDEALAKDLKATYSSRYPVGIFPSGKLFRVLVGPLNEDESGTVLYWFQAKGFQDAFVRSGD